jgi:hypothetical protein
MPGALRIRTGGSCGRSGAKERLVRAKWSPMLSRHAATPKLCMLACMSDGGDRDQMHEFGCFLCMFSEFMTMIDD